MARFDMETLDSSMIADELGRLARERRDADARYNAALTALDRAIVDAQARGLSHEETARLGTALLDFLQQITAFVETKDRHLSAETASRLDTLARALEPIGDLRTQVGVLQRAGDTFVRSATGGSNRGAAPSSSLR